MIKEQIVLYPEPEPIKSYVSPVYSTTGSKINSYLLKQDRVFSGHEIGLAIKSATERGFKVGVYFQYPESKLRYYVKKFESRPAMLDEVKGGPGIIIGQRVGSNVECAFSNESLEDAYICNDINDVIYEVLP